VELAHQRLGQVLTWQILP